MDNKVVKYDALSDMFSFLRMRSIRLSEADISSLEENCRMLVRMMTQKTAGQQRYKPNDVDFRMLDAVTNNIVLGALTLYIMSLSTEELNRAIEICEHMVGLDYKHPYHRHGKAFYKAYRNYYSDVPEGNKILDKLPKELFIVHQDERGTTYHLTKNGFGWLGRQLRITITRR